MSFVSDVVVRPLRHHEMHLPIQWAAKEGWNPGRHDWMVFDAADPGCMLTVVREGRPTGAISAARLSPGLGFIGFFVVPPEYRGNGYGALLWRAALRRLAGGVIGLDGVEAQRENYARAGFVVAHRTLCHGGVAPLRPACWDPRVRRVRPADFPVLAAYDEKCFGCWRPAFLRAWLNLPDSLALLYKMAGEVRGLGVVRRCQQGVRIGPLFANDELVAESLFCALSGFSPGSPLSIDVPEPNASALALARRHGLEPVVEAARMYLGAASARPMGRIYGVTSCALG